MFLVFFLLWLEKLNKHPPSNKPPFWWLWWWYMYTMYDCTAELVQYNIYILWSAAKHLEFNFYSFQAVKKLCSVVVLPQFKLWMLRVEKSYKPLQRCSLKFCSYKCSMYAQFTAIIMLDSAEIQSNFRRNNMIFGFRKMI